MGYYSAAQKVQENQNNLLNAYERMYKDISYCLDLVGKVEDQEIFESIKYSLHKVKVIKDSL